MGKVFTVTVFMAVFLLGVITATTLVGKPNPVKDAVEQAVSAKIDSASKIPVNEEAKKDTRQLDTDQINDAVNSAIETAKNDPSMDKNEAYLSVSKTAGKPGEVKGYLSRTKGH